MMSVVQAKRFANENFPAGPEMLAEEMGVEVRESPLIGCDGWVLSGPHGTVIHLNSASAAPRRRFTLAHELGHLLLGVPTVVGESLYDALKSDDAEERNVNRLAGELLLPESVVRKALPTIPVVAPQLKKLAKLAKVSELAAAIRVVNIASEIGLVNAAVIFFDQDVYKWMFSNTLEMTPKVATYVFQQAKLVKPDPVRLPNDETDGDVIVASIIDNPLLNFSALFVQLLPIETGNQVTIAEKRRQLEEFIYAGDNRFRNQLQGVFSGLRERAATMTLDAAITEFFEIKARKWEGAQLSRLQSKQGRVYVRLRLSEWFER